MKHKKADLNYDDYFFPNGGSQQTAEMLVSSCQIK